VLGWLNAAVNIKASEPFDSGNFLHTLASTLQQSFRNIDAEIGHLKFVITSAGIDAEVVKLWVLADEVRQKYGLLLSPALGIDGAVVAQGKVYKPERIGSLLKG
jgi:hypothetical protein